MLVRKALFGLFLVASLVASLRPLASAPAPVYVTLWFDTEDYILPQDDDATKRLADLLTRLEVQRRSRSSVKRPACSNAAAGRM